MKRRTLIATKYKGKFGFYRELQLMNSVGEKNTNIIFLPPRIAAHRHYTVITCVFLCNLSVYSKRHSLQLN